MHQISVIVPVFNEEATILQVLDSLNSRVENLGEILVIDDASTDQTAEICREYASSHPAVRYFKLPCNCGKTAALSEGFKRSQGGIVIVQDADLEYDPADINRVVEPIQQDTADVVYGSRFQNPDAPRAFYRRAYMANRLLTFLSNLFTGLRLSDVETCYKAFRGEIIRAMVITSARFGFEIEVTAKLVKMEYRIAEVSISYNGRTYAEGKKIGIQDGLMALWYILKYNTFTSRIDSFRKDEMD